MHTDLMRSFGNLSLGSRLRRLSDRLVQDVVDLYRAQGIDLNPTFFPLFNLLVQRGEVGVTQASELLGVSHPAISKIARKMISEGWLTKTPDLEDERRQLLALTPQSLALLDEIKPVWREIKQYLDQLMLSQQHPLLEALNEFEQHLDQQGFYQPVLRAIRDRQNVEDVEIEGWDESRRDDFKRLNMAWLNKYFNGELIDLDHMALDTPESYYLSKGGYIWFACRNDDRRTPVGCIALARVADGRFEISKMAVDESIHGQGVGRELMLQALTKARQLGAEEVFLETASILERAVRLYQNMGFTEIPHPLGKSVFPRSDMYLTLKLGT